MRVSRDSSDLPVSSLKTDGSSSYIPTDTYKPYGQPGAMEWNAMIRTRDGIENLGQYTASAGPWILGFNGKSFSRTP